MTSVAPDLVNALQRDPRAWTKAEIEERWSAAALRASLRRGSVARVARGIYAASEHAESFAVRAHAAHLLCGPESVVIGPGAAAVYGLCDVPEDVTIATALGLKRDCPPWLTIRRLTCHVSSIMWRNCPVATPAWAAVTAYSRAPSRTRDNYIYRAVQSRLASASDIFAVAAAMPRLRGRRHLEFVAAATREGSESHLETVGLRDVFNTQEFADFIRQHRVVTPAGTMRLDLYHPLSKTAVELDGAGVHGKVESRISDIRRDTEVARLGILTVRLHSSDVFRRKVWCRQSVLDIVELRS